MRETARILNKLLSDGELGASDGALLADYRVPEVRAELDVWGEELGFSLVEMRGKVYLVPHTDSGLLSLSIKDIRESESKSDKMIDAFLQCYVTMTILWMFYGGRNINPKKALFLQVKDIVAALDERFADASSPQAQALETDFEINFPQIASHWNALPIHDAQRRKTRVGAVLKACRLMERQKLLIVLDEDREIRPTERMDDLMIGYYLDMRRIEDIHALFDSMGGSGDADAQ
jgi:hypothetical protein